MDDKLQDITAEPSFFRLQPTFRALPAVQSEMVGRETVATQRKFKSFQTTRQPPESDDGVPQRTSGIFRHMNRKHGHSKTLQGSSDCHRIVFTSSLQGTNPMMRGRSKI